MPFPEGSVKRVRAGARRRLILPDPPSRQKIVAMVLSERGLSGEGLAGEELFLVPAERLVSELRLAQLLEEIAVQLKVPAAGLALLRKGQVLASKLRWSALQDFLPETVMRVDVNCDEVFPLVCRRTEARYLEPCCGEGTLSMNDIKIQELPKTLQALHEHRLFVTDTPDEGGHCLLSYGRSGVLAIEVGHPQQDVFVPIGYFPMAPLWHLPANSRQWGGRNLDVWSCSKDIPEIRRLLDAHASETEDRPLPRYQMVVDPNQFVYDTADGPAWVPCEFDVAADGSARLVGGLTRKSHDQSSWNARHEPIRATCHAEQSAACLEALAATLHQLWPRVWRSPFCRHRSSAEAGQVGAAPPCGRCPGFPVFTWCFVRPRFRCCHGYVGRSCFLTSAEFRRVAFRTHLSTRGPCGAGLSLGERWCSKRSAS